MIGTVAGLTWFSRVRNRIMFFGLAILLLGALAIFPERYRAAVTLTPTDPQSLGLSGALGQLGALNSVFGNQAAVEIALRVGRSVYVRDIVIKRTRLGQRIGLNSREELHRWLDSRVDIRSLRGGIVSIEMKSRDTSLAKDIVAAYANAMQDRLAQIGRTQTAYKRSVLLKLVADSATGLALAQSNYDNFRLLNRTTSPSGTVELVNSRMTQLESAVKAKQVDLTVARQLYTDNNNIVRQIRTELGALQNQLAQVRATSPGGDTTLGQAVTNSGRLFKLERELGIARALYDSYMRYLQGTAVEDMASDANVRILEPAFIDTERQIWWPAFSAALAILLLWGAIEVYRMRPPVGARMTPGAEHG